MNLPDFKFEKSQLPSDCRYLLGIDEVGRGPFAGSVTIGAFLLDLHTFDPQEFINLGVRDSKLLSAQKRQKIHEHFLNSGHRFTTFSSTSVEIDKQGIAICIYSLITKALKFYRTNFDYCLIDGNYNVNKLINTQSIIKGDQKCFSIASASIVAKVDRDQQMDQCDKDFPDYGFSAHKGYGTKTHLEAIKKYGPCPIHRFSFSPISKAK
ncbi:ribonuclease HII [Candidatus Shapirobacteria bacterium]|nr:ribonuclease HII [Candidatus Shapirobacteria bacterium]